MSEAVAIREAEPLAAWNPHQVVAQVQLVQRVMKEVMKDGEHFGVIPGTQKPTLLQPGAQKLCMTFRLAPEYNVTQTDLPGGHREYRTDTILRSITSGVIVGSGVGVCSTMETKYRYRQGERLCPACQKATIIKGKAEFGGGWLCFAKKGGCGAKYKEGDPAIEGQQVGRVENPDIADCYNVALKMSKKRSFVDAVLQALAVSDIFTQDLEEQHEPIQPKAEESKAEPKPSVVEPEVVEPAESVNIALKEWLDDIAKADSIAKLQAIWKDLNAPMVWSMFSTMQHDQLTKAKDARKVELK